MTKEDSYSRLSASIACIRFPLIITIILYHAYIVTPISNHQLYYQFIYPFGLWIGETGVPAFFFISGLFFFYSQKSFFQKIKSRIRTLVIPYFLWNTIMLILFIITFIIGYHIVINNVKEIGDYLIIDYIRAYWDCGDWNEGIGKPIYPPMWFLRNLMILCIISPLIEYIIIKSGLLLPLITSIIWINTPNMGLTYESISAFCLGAFFSIKKINLLDVFSRYKVVMFGLFVFLGVLDIITHTLYPVPYNLQVHRISIYMNILMIPAIGSILIEKRLNMSFFSPMSFFIYCIHLPITIIVRKPLLWYPNLSDFTHIFLYFVSSTLIICICIIIYFILKRLMPSFLKFATGNRF